MLYIWLTSTPPSLARWINSPCVSALAKLLAINSEVLLTAITPAAAVAPPNNRAPIVAEFPDPPLTGANCAFRLPLILRCCCCRRFIWLFIRASEIAPCSYCFAISLACAIALYCSATERRCIALIELDTSRSFNSAFSLRAAICCCCLACALAAAACAL